jgi:thiol:disulfide interchange protein
MSLASITVEPVLATLILSTFVLIAGTWLCITALASDKDEVAKQVFAIVGVLFGLLAAGGLGTLFTSKQVETAENSAQQAGAAAAKEVSSKVSKQVDEALNAPPPSTAQPQK